MSNFSLIRKFADEKKISMRELSSRIGKDETTLQAIIRNGSTNTKTIEKIASVLEVPVGAFFDDHSVSARDIYGNTNSPVGSTIGDNNFNNSATTAEERSEFINVIKTYQEQTSRLLSVIEKLSEKYRS
jgi:transcriptional regulator with XRE-family HTH domain